MPLFRFSRAVSALFLIGGGAAAVSGHRSAARASGWHVNWYHLQLRLDPATKSVVGTTIIRASARARVLAVRLDLDSVLSVDSTAVDNRSAQVTRRGSLMEVTLPAPVGAGRSFVLAIHYHGTPRGRGLAFDTVAGSPVIGSYGMPYSARDWWPSEDSPSDKADSADMEFTLPRELIAVSNGRLIGRRDNADNTATTHWAVRYPIYPDVISIAAAPYRTFTLHYHSASGVDMPMPFFVYAEDSTKAFADFSVLPGVMAHHAARFGEYPFLREKYGVAEFPVQSFREHQTIPSWGRGMITGDHRNDLWLAHELAHQWFGNALTVHSWSDIWLNEGFATYAALLWLEQTKGDSAYQAAIQARMRLPFPFPVYRLDSADVSTLFGPVTFQKGALVLHMLRHIMGDSSFFLAMRQYVQGHLYRNVTTADFERAAEQVYGKSLRWFFQEWVYRGGQPKYQVAWSPLPGGRGRVGDLTVTQAQDSTLFTMPIDVSLTDRSGAVKTIVVRDSLRTQQFRVTAADSVTVVTLDPGHWVLRTP